MNAAYALSTGDAIVFTGDTTMPQDWLKNMIAVMEESGADFVQYYTAQGMTFASTRILGPEQKIAGFSCKMAMPFEQIMFKRYLLKKVGYFREEFGLYGWSDEEWFLRMHAMGCKGFTIMDALTVHEGITGTGIYTEGHPETKEYWEFKHAQCTDPNKLALMESLKSQGYPFTSFQRLEILTVTPIVSRIRSESMTPNTSIRCSLAVTAIDPRMPRRTYSMTSHASS